MRRSYHVLFMLCLSFAFAPAALAQDEPDAAAMQKWMEYMTPGEGHAALKFKEGSWSGHVKMWMTPEAPPSESDATSETKFIMDGRYLVDHVNGSFDGMPFEGIGTTAYDNHLKKYLFSWIDNMGTGIMTGEGSYDAEKKAWTYHTQMVDPMTGKLVKARSVERILGPDNWVMESYAAGPDGKEYKNMEITYTRKK